jgi:hypothetical protein
VVGQAREPPALCSRALRPLGSLACNCDRTAGEIAVPWGPEAADPLAFATAWSLAHAPERPLRATLTGLTGDDGDAAVHDRAPSTVKARNTSMEISLRIKRARTAGPSACGRDV